MGRAFEYRKARKLKRWGNMARVFTRLGKEIEMAVKAGGADPNSNSKLRLLMHNAKTENMPKENVERAIKRATDKDTTAYKEITYEGYAAGGVAVVVETATDNPTRTVANVRAAFNRCDGSLGTSGMTDFLFERKCNFKVAAKDGLDMEELELELIDFGVDECFKDGEEIFIYADFTAFGPVQKYLEDNGFEIKTFSFERIPNDYKEVTPEQQEEVEKLIGKLEDDEDVVNVFHNMKE
ncbi:MAG: YebC/PmpR family DNA-binding transcriptional regulator [Bacteroidales bacterium]|jgi:YebC/PmpR family DNA-binding regulatory protein|nr:YebC/PmpR family DNA-binding transcriptional regulator [Bacteroidales bacterium]